MQSQSLLDLSDFSLSDLSESSSDSLDSSKFSSSLIEFYYLILFCCRLNSSENICG